MWLDLNWICRMAECPICRREGQRVICYGLPMWLCSDERCSCVFGFWEWVTRRLPFNGMFFVYGGFYPSALFAWLRGAL